MKSQFDVLLLPREFTGKGAAQGWFDFWQAIAPSAQWHVVSAYAVGDAVLAKLTVRSALRPKELTSVDSRGTFTLCTAIAAHFADGRISLLENFLSGSELSRQLGEDRMPQN